MRRSLLVLVAISLCITGCLDRTRVNTKCEWPPESVRALDLNDWPQQRHLYADVELAEELAIRYADAVNKARTGYTGHGGLIDGGRLRDRCMASLTSAIAATHDLSVERVEQARARGYRDPRWDVGVLLSFACLYVFLAWMIVRAISRRFPADEGWPALAAPLLLSFPVSILAFQLFTLWGGTLEIIRLGNGHVSSYRAAKSPWPAHSATLLVAGVMVFLLVGGVHHWVGKHPVERRV